MTSVLIIAGTAVVAGLGLLVWKKWMQVQEDSIFCRCHVCHEKIRFTADRAGSSASCPKCQKRWTIPAPGAANHSSQSGTAFTQPKPRVIIARKLAGSR